MSDPGHVGPKIYPTWFDVIRQIVMFILGVALVIFAVVTPGYDIPFLVMSLILFGLVPAERFLLRKEAQKEEADARSRPRRLDQEGRRVRGPAGEGGEQVEGGGDLE
jgi:flagellar biosynthesis component FlhA